jgi:hypothetical protein
MNAIEENLKTLFSHVGYNLVSNIQTYSSSKLGMHRDTTLNKFECTSFNTMTNLSSSSI